MARLRDINRANRKRGMPARVKWDYVPTPRQLEAHKAPERYKLYGGAMGGGKSYWLCAEAIRLSMKYPGNRGYLCRQHVLDVRRSTLVTLERMAPKGAIWRHLIDDRIFEFWNGSQIVYGGLGHTEEIERIKSTEFGWFAIDEISETAEAMFQLLCSRLRWILPNGKRPPYYGLAASNPEPGWVKKRFVDQKLENHAFIPALPRDNPHLPSDYVTNLTEMFPDEAAKRYVQGSWDVFEGQIFKEFDRDRHIYSHDIFDLPDSEHYVRFRVLDHGYVNPTCMLWVAIDFDGRMYIFNEHYQAGLTIDEHAVLIKERYGKWDEDIITLCDPSMFSRTMQKTKKAWSPADEYRDNGIVCIKPYGEDGKISEMSGINLVKQRLKHDMLFIHESCTNTIDEIISYKWAKLKAASFEKNMPERAVDRDNHAMDALRYACMWRPMSAEKPKVPESRNTLHYAILAHKKLIHKEFYAGWN